MVIDLNEPMQQDLQMFRRSNYKQQYTADSFVDTIVEKPWGYEYLLYQSNDVAIWILHIRSGHKTSLHCHPNKSTSLICLHGEIQCRSLSNTYTLHEFEAIYLGSKVYHQSFNPTPRETVLIEIESPSNKMDLLRSADEYGRTNTHYETGEFYQHKPGLTLPSETQHDCVTIHGKTVSITRAKTLDDLRRLIHLGRGSTLTTCLDRHVWDNLGKKSIQVGQVFMLNEAFFDAHRINDNFTYLHVHRE